ncbi:hypothetical protein D3C73_856130 [compost metagenome]
MTLFGGRLQALLAAVAFLRGALQGRGVGLHVQATALAIEQQGRARRQQQHRRAGTDQRRDAQCASDNGTVGGGTTPGGENASNPGGIQARHVGRSHFVHYQNVRLIRFVRGLDATQLRQHSTTDVAQVRRALGQQRVLQRFLLPGRRFDHGHPGRFGTFTLLETGLDLIGQLRVVEHFLMGDKNLANRLGLAALDQTGNVLPHPRQRLLQALALDGGGLTPQRIIDGLLHLDMCRADGNARRRRNGPHHATGHRSEQHFGDLDLGLLAHSRQRFDLFTQAFFDGRQQCRQCIRGDVRLSDQFQHLTATGAEAEQLAQALH